MTVTIRVPRRAPLPPPPDPIPLHRNCLCVGCYFVATEGEMCLRCTLDGCDHEVNRHA